MSSAADYTTLWRIALDIMQVGGSPPLWYSQDVHADRYTYGTSKQTLREPGRPISDFGPVFPLSARPIFLQTFAPSQGCRPAFDLHARFTPDIPSFKTLLPVCHCDASSPPSAKGFTVLGIDPLDASQQVGRQIWSFSKSLAPPMMATARALGLQVPGKKLYPNEQKSIMSTFTQRSLVTVGVRSGLVLAVKIMNQQTQSMLDDLEEQDEEEEEGGRREEKLPVHPIDWLHEAVEFCVRAGKDILSILTCRLLEASLKPVTSDRTFWKLTKAPLKSFSRKLIKNYWVLEFTERGAVMVTRALSLAFLAHWLVGVGFDAALRIHKLSIQSTASADDMTKELQGAASRAGREAVRQAVILVCSAVTSSVVVYAIGRHGSLAIIYHIGFVGGEMIGASVANDVIAALQL